MNDWALLRQFCENGSEEAFAQLLKAHLPLVYSVALRQTRGDTALAEEIAQLTFCVLARKGGSISRDTILAAWLCRTAFYTAQKAIRSEQRRRLREHQAAIMQRSSHIHEEEAIWTDIAPHVDEVINLLPEKERGAIILRFFEQKPMRELAASLGITEEAARMRISRSLEKLRILLAKRGVALTSVALASILTEKSLAAVPATLFEHLRRVVLHPGSGTTHPGSSSRRLTSSLEMARTVAIIALASVLITSITVYQRKKRLERDAATIVAATMSAETSVRGEPDGELFDLSEANENLRKALRDPWPSRKPPYERVDEALARYGRHKTKAIRVLMEMFNGLRSSHTAESMKLGAHGLMLFGPQAEETLRDLIVLHDSGDLMWLDESVADLFAAIDPAGSTIPKFIDKLREPQPMNYTDLILVRLFNNIPGTELIYRDQLCELLSSKSPDTRAHAAFVVAGIPGMNEAAAFTNILSALRPEQFQSYIIPNDEFQTAQDKRWRLHAIDALRQLGDPEAVSPLFEIAHSEALDKETRDAALMVIADLDPKSQTQSPEVNARVSEHAEGMRLSAKAQGGKATYDELVEGLRHRESVTTAAQALSENKDQVSAALPMILSAVENFQDVEVIGLIKQVEPALLLDQLKQGQTDGLKELANVLALGQPPLREAIPYLDEIIDHLDQRKVGFEPTLNAIHTAVQNIDPDHDFLYLTPPFSGELRKALNEAAIAVGTSNVSLETYRQYLADRHFIRVTRVRAMVEALSADPRLNELFVSRVISNPMLQPFAEQIGVHFVRTGSVESR